ncbi:MAG: DNA repair protein RecN [Bryobacterales bacterium]|nr:DNA repair protein RecN [Bryobacteraceae bacterium]MDW8130662.1 DNA repair protein RecN [Bryobacterales bacterium]
MLVELVVENYAVIEHVRVRFHPGLNLLTGETGSGKSIVVDALALLLGARATADLVRSGAQRARVAGIFELPADAELERLLREAGIETDEGELLLEREILAEGKSRAFAGSRPVTAALLREIGSYLADIHGQHEQQRLFQPATQLRLLDTFAGLDHLRDRMASLYRRWRGAAAAVEELEKAEQEKLRLADLWAYQMREISEAAPRAGEDAALEQERRVLQNVARLQEHAGAAFEALYDSPDCAIARTRQALRRLEELARIDASLATARDELRQAEIAIQEASYALRDYLSRLEANPARLEQVESRLAVLERLKRKYGPSLEDVLAYQEELSRQLGALESAAERKVALARERDQLASEFAAAAAEASVQRQAAARRLARRMEAELAALAMPGAAFRIEVRQASWHEYGRDAVEFLVAANPGDEPRPLEKVASGGELSRIALALRTLVGAAGRTAGGEARTLVFDEVDTGIGGRVAETVGRRLKQLAARYQVLCVTHLPQIASFADHHYFVEKREVGGRPVASVCELDEAGRAREIGRMLSGERVTPEALRHAERLLRMARG